MLGVADALSLPCVVTLLLGVVKDVLGAVVEGKSTGRKVTAYPPLALTPACRRLCATFRGYAVVQSAYLRRELAARDGFTRLAAARDPGWNSLWKLQPRLCFSGDCVWDEESEKKNEQMNACIYYRYKIKDQQHLLQEEDGPEVEDEDEDEDEDESEDE